MIDASAFHVKLTERMREQFDLYAELLLQWNEKMNLTRITDRKEMETLHFLDSLAGCMVLFPEGEECTLRVTDLGSGAGFPGVPIKIAYPGIELTVIDSVKKKLTFVDAVAKALSFDTATFRTVHGRAEDLGKDRSLREAQDAVVSRAVANLSTLSELALPLVKLGGMFVAYKGPEVEGEVADAKNAIHLLGGHLREIRTFVLPGTDVARSLVVIDKESSTPSEYPRRAPLPRREPL